MKVAHVLGRNEYRAEPTGIHGEYTSRRISLYANWINTGATNAALKDRTLPGRLRAKSANSFLEVPVI